MAQIKSRKHSKTASIVALAAALPLAAQAAGTEQQATQLPTITVKSEAENKYKADKVSSAKYTQPLADTPQTISVIKKELLKEQGATSLTEALRNTPGITLQLGENGNTSAGDSFQMRGFDTKNSIYLDGIRDIGAISRDIFNLEQVEVVKGPSGAEAGRGGAGGYINLVSKLPHLESSQEVSATYNTAEHARLTADINQALSAGTAVRLNVMGQEGGVDGRDYVENNSYAVAPSIAFGLDSDTRFYLYSQHVRQRNIPDGGIPTIGMKGFYYNNTDAKLTQAQRDAMTQAIARHFPPGTRATRPEGGYFLWLELPPGCDAWALYQRALQHGISIAPGPIFSASRGFAHCLRLNYGQEWNARSEAALATLGQLAHAL